MLSPSVMNGCDLPPIPENCEECLVCIVDDYSSDECQITISEESSGDDADAESIGTSALRSCPKLTAWPMSKVTQLHYSPCRPDHVSLRITGGSFGASPVKRHCVETLMDAPPSRSPTVRTTFPASHYYENCMGAKKGPSQPELKSTHDITHIDESSSLTRKDIGTEHLSGAYSHGEYGTLTTAPRARRVATPCAAKTRVADTDDLKVRMRRKGEFKFTSIARQNFVQAWGKVSAAVWWALVACDCWVGYVVLNCVIWAAQCECDQPLWRYLAVGWALFSGLTSGIIDKVALLVSVRHAMICETFFSCFAFAWLVQGCMWVAKANRCGATSPILFWTAWASTAIQWNFIFLSIIVSIFFMTASAFSLGKEA